MNYKIAAFVFFAAFSTLFLADNVKAQGVIVPIICDIRPCPPRPPRPVPRPLPNFLPVKSINIETKINGQTATTYVTQVFRNDSPYTLEGTYFFPIPETASISEFAIWENGKKLVGEVRTKEEARRIYNEIVRRQRDPGLLEYAGKDLFQASIFPILPNSDKKLEITYTQILKANSGTVSYRYPLGTGSRAWTNPPPVPVMDSETAGGRRRDGQPDKIGTVAGRIEIIATQALKNIYSPSHNVDIKRSGENKAVLTFEATGKNQDFQLFYGLSEKDFGLSLLTYREAAKDGYFMLIVSPKDKVLESEIAAKDIVFVLDTSGSMADEGKMEKARAALLFGIRTLRENDRFNVINFAGEEHLMESNLIQANSSGKKRGEEFVNKLTPTGGTNINDALRASLRQFDNSKRPKLLVFITDGLPTVGETIIEKIIANAAQIKVENLRLFSFGVGYDVNTRLLDKLAEENSGTAEYIEPKEDLEIKVSNFFTKVSSPVLTNIEFNFGSVQTDLIYPRKTPDLFRGSQIILLGKYKNSSDLKNAVIHLTGKNQDESRSFNYENLSFPLRAEENNFLPRLWATRRVGWLIEQIRINGEQKELRDEVVELGTRFGIVTPYTSYLATDGSENDVITGTRNRQITALPAMRRSAAKSAPTLVIAESAADAKGQASINLSKSIKDKKEAEKIDNQSAVNIKTIKNKTFYLDEKGIWIDSEFKETDKLTEITLKFASEEFFDFVSKNAELSEYFSLGEKIILVWNKKVYRIR